MRKLFCGNLEEHAPHSWSAAMLNGKMATCDGICFCDRYPKAHYATTCGAFSVSKFFDSVVDFLETMIAEDMQSAEAAVDPDRPGTHWEWVREDDIVITDPTWEDMPVSLRSVEEYPSVYNSVSLLPAFFLNHVEADEPRALPHIARHDPARVLAECEAHKEILKWHGPELGGDVCDEWEQWPCPTIRALASIYSDRPGYQEEWKV